MKTLNVTSNKKVQIYNLSEPLGDARTAKIEVNVSDGNLVIDGLTDGEAVLANGTLEHTEKQGPPWRSVDISNRQASLTLKAGNSGQPWFRFPWSACNGATEWQIHLNPKVQMDITAHSGGGNVQLDLAGMVVNNVLAETGGGNMKVVLPDNAANLNVVAKSGAGKVTVEIGDDITGSNSIDAGSGAGDIVVRVPNNIAAHIHATTGLGKTIIEPRFNKVDKDTYQSPEYDSAMDKIEILAHSGAGNVSVSLK
ncbi:MAG: hypothetical protein ACM3PS_12260 [Syntrophothermus sp.]